MKKLALALLFCGASAFAASVTYGTSVSFTGPDISGNGLANGTANIVFDAIPAGTTVSAPTNISLGTFNVSGGSGAINDSVALTITQTSPDNGAQIESSTVDGTITGNSNNIVLTFAPTTFSIGSAYYTLQSVYELVPPTTNNGNTSIQATVAVSPEPASIGLLGASLLGIGMAFRRRAVK